MGTAAPASRRPGGRWRTDVLALLVVGALVGITAAATALATTSTGSGPAVSPVLVPGNPPCSGQLKIEPVRSGTFATDFGGLAGSITITVRDTAGGPVFDFATDSASHLVKVVVVKGGPNANVYDYGAGVSADSGLHAPLNKDEWYGLSHLCFATGAAPPPTDVCPNIGGIQTSIPPGMIKDAAGNCVTPPVDVCPNIDGVQTTIPPGMVKDAAGNCVTPPVDVCPNIAGVQTSVPPGMIKDAAGNCVTPPGPPPTDECPNIDGVQTSVPPGMVKDASGNCVTPPVDVCPNIEGLQTTVPAGMIKDSSGNCVTPAGPPAPLVDLAVTKLDTPDPVSAGNLLRYTIRVTNRGPGNATGVTVTDDLPSGVRLISTRASQGSCSASGSRITCRLGRLAVGASATVAVNVRPTTAGLIRNVARVFGSEGDPNPTNNTDTVTTRVAAPFQPPSAVCDTVTAGTRAITVGSRTTLRLVVKGRGRPVVNARVRVRGAGIDVTARTNRKGVAVVRVRATKRGIVTISVAGFRNCGRRIGAVDGGQPDLTG